MKYVEKNNKLAGRQACRHADNEMKKTLRKVHLLFSCTHHMSVGFSMKLSGDQVKFMIRMYCCVGHAYLYYYLIRTAHTETQTHAHTHTQTRIRPSER